MEQAVHTPEVPAAASGLPAVHVHRFPNLIDFHAVSFSPDGKIAYCSVEDRAIDLWSAAWSLWPEYLGAILLLTIIAWVVCVRRVVHRRQISGIPYCRGCNYNVIVQVPEAALVGKRRVLPARGTVCPECGADLARRPPRPGRSAVRRLWLVTSMPVIVALVLGIMLASGVRRDGRGSTWLGVWSTWVDEQAQRHRLTWLTQFQARVFRVERVETESGRVLGRLCTSREPIWGTMLTSPDGEHLVLSRGRGWLVWMNTRTGAAKRSPPLVEKFRTGPPVPVGFDGPPDDPWVYFSSTMTKPPRSRLMRWRPSTQEQEVVIDEPAYTGMGPRGPYWAGRKYALLHWPRGTAYVSATGHRELQETGKIELRIIPSVGGDVQNTWTIPYAGGMLFSYFLRTAPDGSSVSITSVYDSFMAIDPRSGLRLDRVTPQPREAVAEQTWLGVSGDGRRMFAFDRSIQRNLRVLDRDGQIIGTLLCPDSLKPMEATASPDGRWLAVSAFDSQPVAGGPGKYAVVFFDLDRLGKAEAP